MQKKAGHDSMSPNPGHTIRVAALATVFLAALFVDLGAAGDQQITANPLVQVAAPDTPVRFDVFYSTADPVDETLTGLGLRLHFDSKKLTFRALTNLFGTHLVAQGQSQPDRGNFDGDSRTDTVVNVAWADPFGSSWPGEGTTPLLLYTPSFVTTGEFAGTTVINFSATSTAAGYRLIAGSVSINSTVAATEDPTPSSDDPSTGGAGGSAAPPSDSDATDPGPGGRTGGSAAMQRFAPTERSFPGQSSVSGSAAPTEETDCTDGSCAGDVRVTTAILTVSTGGDGRGSVTISPSGLRCTTACSQSFERGAEITMTAAPEAGSVFSGWKGGADCSERPFTLARSRNCVAHFETEKRKLAITRVGGGTSRVMSTPAGIDCGPNCTAMFTLGAVVQLAAPAGGDAVFMGWTGHSDCADGKVEMQDNRDCTANFAGADSNLNVLVVGKGSGTVTSTPPGIDCEGSCSHSFQTDEGVELKAVPDEDSVFAGWSGDPDCDDGRITISDRTNCRAMFALKRFTLTVSQEGKGRGLVASDPAGIECGEHCTHEFDIHSTVELKAFPAHGAAFTSWGGDPDCADGEVLLEGVRNCTANFVATPRTAFLCYATRSTKQVGRRLSLGDAFETTEVEVRDGVSLCNPVTSKGEEIADGGSYLQGYRVQVPKGQRPRGKKTNIKVENQFGVISLDTRRADRILVPAVRSESGAPQESRGDLGQFKCYLASTSGGKKGLAKDLEASVKRASKPENRFRLKGLTRICNQVDAGKEDRAVIGAADEHLLCYRVRRPKGAGKRFKSRDVNITSQFGSTRVTPRRPEEFCVVSKRVR